MKVFVVMGSTGSYEDVYEWAVRAFLVRDQAEAFEAACNKSASEHKETRSARLRVSNAGGKPFDFAGEAELRKTAVPGDPKFEFDGSTHYFTNETDLDGAPDETLAGIRVVLDHLLAAGGQVGAAAVNLANALGIDLGRLPTAEAPVSTDYSAVCVECRCFIHIGQRFTSGWSFGYGTGDVSTQRRQGEWIMKHLEPAVGCAICGGSYQAIDGSECPACNGGAMHTVQIMPSDCVPEGFESDDVVDR